METITKYKAIDGKEFNSYSECEAYEKLIHRVNDVMKALPIRPEDVDFSNGSGYIQHDRKIFLTVKKDLLSIIYEKIDHKWINQRERRY